MSTATVRLTLLLMLGTSATLAAQIPAQQPTGVPAQQTTSIMGPPAVPAEPPSQMVRPAIRNLLSTLDSIRAEKWKGSSANRERTQANLESVRKDLDSNLPSLLQSADLAPGSLPALLPAARNLDALYDVVLRITEAAHTGAPGRESAELDSALANLEQSRRDFNARILSAAQADQGEIRSLRQQLAARAVAPPAPEPKPCPKPVVKKKHTARKKATTD